MKLKTWLEHKQIKEKELIKLLRKEHVFISQSAVNKWVNGDRIPSPNNMKAINNVTGGLVNANDFFLID